MKNEYRLGGEGGSWGTVLKLFQTLNNIFKAFNEMEAYTSTLGLISDLLTHLLTYWSVHMMLLYPIWSFFSFISIVNNVIHILDIFENRVL